MLELYRRMRPDPRQLGPANGLPVYPPRPPELHLIRLLDHASATVQKSDGGIYGAGGWDDVR